ncbi:hypothetical protein ACGFSB_34605 [Streptomyces sp. NPDC048441]|uniref:hypothetical protein n=1 Tax=Streptomyces sp. NPDC048441 TaxID=3365552 RepID=UPI003710A080
MLDSEAPCNEVISTVEIAMKHKNASSFALIAALVLGGVAACGEADSRNDTPPAPRPKAITKHAGTVTA